MNRLASLVSSLVLITTAACGPTYMQPRSADANDAWSSYGHDRAHATDAKDDGADSAAPTSYEVAARKPGDFVVYRFTGSFRKEPVVLTQRVIAREGNVVVVDATLEEGGKKQTLRLRMSDSAASRGEITSVARLDGDREIPAEMASYDAMMAKTTMSADENEALVAEEDVTVDVGKDRLPCRQTTYRVRIGKKEGTMKTISSDRFVWGDVGAEIATSDGRVLYKAQVIETGAAPMSDKPAASPVAGLADE